MKKKIRLIIVDDHQLFREGLKQVLNLYNNLEVVAITKNGKEFLNIFEKIQADVILMDIEMPEMNGIEATKFAIKKSPRIKIIALTSFSDDIYYYDMIKAGALGFLFKDTDPDELEKAINEVVNGNSYFSQELLRKIIYNVDTTGEISRYEQNEIISKREHEVLLLVCQGYSNIEIGERLFISPRTVDKHRSSLLSKTGTKNSANLVMYAIKQKIIKI